MTRLFRYVLLAGSFLTILALSFSCKEEKDTTGIITVEYNDGKPVQNALVRVYGDPSDTIYATKKVKVDKEERTDASGTVQFKFDEHYEDGQSGLMVLDIDVKKDSLSAEDYIEIKHAKKNEKNVKLEY